ncbi:exportin-1 [Rhizoctonia solani AG-1 IA]|uniref:Exportin-1 n=1 Tax=Thanatephorus cucumeris (strain AG1-IA) TaxID=983506 RepID=L8X761_THACA|nr:exportin-1 [Rhizoctonia solani AG-1 IA]
MYENIPENSRLDNSRARAYVCLPAGYVEQLNIARRGKEYVHRRAQRGSLGSNGYVWRWRVLPWGRDPIFKRQVVSIKRVLVFVSSWPDLKQPLPSSSTSFKSVLWSTAYGNLSSRYSNISSTTPTCTIILGALYASLPKAGPSSAHSIPRTSGCMAEGTSYSGNFGIHAVKGLQILEKLIQTRWKILPEDQRQGIRNFIVSTTLVIAADETSLRQQKTYLNKLNLALVQQEWPHNWPTFIPEIVQNSKTNIALCENNMAILKLLSEEIFDYSAEQMTQTKTKNLKNQMCGEFSEIFNLCLEVLEKAQKPSLIRATLETMLRFLNWIPLGILFTMVMTSINKMIPPSTNIAQAYETSSDQDQELILNLALFLANFLTAHLRAVENAENRDVLLNAHLYMVKVSQVEEREVFKICLEYWSKLVAELYEEQQSLPMGGLGGADASLLMGLNLGGGGAGAQAAGMLGGVNLRKNAYAEVLSNLRLVMIERMVKPEEVLVVENDEGEVVREFLKESDTIVLYKAMREVLVYLTHLDVLDTENILTEKLAKQVDGSEWSWANLNTLCWAIGSISGAMNEETEKRFLVTVIKDLLGLCEMKRGKDNKAIVASNIMYIVGQYPRFLKAHWKFLKTVVNKLFEFMHETHEGKGPPLTLKNGANVLSTLGVQDMACDTFIKIAQKCRRHFVMQQAGETEPFVDEILRGLHRITVDLSPQQVHTFYEAVGYMVSAQPNKSIQERLIMKLMDLPNNAWDSLMSQAASNVDVLGNSENVKILSNVLKTNVSACVSIGGFFLPQIGRIFNDMLGLYKAVSTLISEQVAKEGPIATRTPKVRSLRTIKKEILKLMETYVKKAEDLDTLYTNFIPPLLEAVLGDYNRNVPHARDAEVLNVMATITSRLQGLLTPQVPAILDAVFECTLEMISKDFAEYPEHRSGFFKLLRAIDMYCFPVITRAVSNFLAESCKQSDHDFTGFKHQSLMLQRLFQLVESNSIHAPLFDPSTQPSPPPTNQQFLREYTATLLKNIQSFVVGLCDTCNDIGKFKLLLRDFLISLRESSNEDNAELYLEEKEAEQQRKLAEERAAAERVPGMLKPSQIKEEDEEL